MADLSRFRPAFIGGSVIGILALIPYVSYGAFLWAVLGGMMAAKLLSAHDSAPLTLRRGAKVGLLAGCIGGGIYLVVSTPLMANLIVDSLIASAGATPEARAIFVSLHQKLLLKYAISFLVAFLIASLLLGFAVLGGLLGAALFDRHKRPSATTGDETTAENKTSLSH
jgi:hypothetical protein